MVSALSFCAHFNLNAALTLKCRRVTQGETKRDAQVTTLSGRETVALLFRQGIDGADVERRGRSAQPSRARHSMTGRAMVSCSCVERWAAVL